MNIFNNAVNFIKPVLDFLGLNAIRNLTAIIAVVIAIIGGKKVLNRYTEYRLVAAANFYAPFRIYLFQLRNSITLKKGVDYSFSPALFALSENLNYSGIKHDDAALIKEKENLGNLSKEFLEFLSKANNQFPDSKKKDRKLWRRYLNSLVNYLIDLENLNRGITVSCLDGKSINDNLVHQEELIKQIKEYYDDLISLIGKILEYIDRYEDKYLN